MRILRNTPAAALLIFGVIAIGCSNQQIDGFHKGADIVAAATTQPFVTVAEDFPIVGDWIKVGADFIAAIIKLVNALADLLRPPAAAVPR